MCRPARGSAYLFVTDREAVGSTRTSVAPMIVVDNPAHGSPDVKGVVSRWLGEQHRCLSNIAALQGVRIDLIDDAVRVRSSECGVWVKAE
jgi:hypothetical protein